MKTHGLVFCYFVIWIALEVTGIYLVKETNHSLSDFDQDFHSVQGAPLLQLKNSQRTIYRSNIRRCRMCAGNISLSKLKVDVIAETKFLRDRIKIAYLGLLLMPKDNNLVPKSIRICSNFCPN